MQVYRRIVEQLSQLFPNNWDNCSTLVALLTLLLASGTGSCVSGAAAGPQRQSADWRGDLISALLDAEMLDTAERFCERHLRQADASSDQAARWAIRLASVRAARITAHSQWDAQLAERAREPLEQLLQAYPDHERAAWLQTQLAIVDLATVKHAALALALSPDDKALRSRGLQFVTRGLRQLESVADQLGTLNPSGDDDLQSLRQTIAQQRVEALLWRGRMFAPGSDDAIASAAEAEREARDVLAQLPGGSLTHHKIRLLRAEALIAAGNPQAALQILDEVQRAAQGQLSSQALALQIRALLAREDTVAAVKQLDAYYGDDPASAPRSAEMDLVRLAWLLNSVQQAASDERQQRLAAVADWLDAIERRSGTYARRRGEAEMLRVVRVQPQQGDARLIAAEAARQLRAGNARSAGELLAQAAAASSDSASALRYATQSAAVLKSAGRLPQAAEVLSETARRHAADPASAALHLQAARLIFDSLQQDKAPEWTRLQTVLEATAETWPRSSQSQVAVEWLVRLLEGQHRYAAAAQWALSDAIEPSADSLLQAGRLWQAALRQAPEDANLLQQAVTSLEKAAAEQSPDVQSEAAQQILRIVTLHAAPDDLRQWATRLPSDAAADPLLAWLLPFRLQRATAETLKLDSPSGDDTTQQPIAQQQTAARSVADAVVRLLRDGEASPSERVRVGEGILRLLEALPEEASAQASEQEFEPLQWKARALSWTGQWQAADRLFQQAITQHPGDLATIRTAAEQLAESSSPEAQRRSIEYWSKIASGVAQGSAEWHRAKLQTIRLHLALADKAAAARLCKFVLLTRPPEDAQLRAEYERYLQQAR